MGTFVGGTAPHRAGGAAGFYLLGRGDASSFLASGDGTDWTPQLGGAGFHRTCGAAVPAFGAKNDVLGHHSGEFVVGLHGLERIGIGHGAERGDMAATGPSDGMVAHVVHKLQRALQTLGRNEFALVVGYGKAVRIAPHALVVVQLGQGHDAVFKRQLFAGAQVHHAGHFPHAVEHESRLAA